MDILFPKYLSIQTTSLCNGHCIFCPYDDIKDMFPKKIMEENLFKKIIDECSGYPGIERLILYLNNEPLTDPLIIERINYAKEKVPWASVHLLTNGSLLTNDLANKLINSKLDWIGISLHGIKKETIEKAMGLNYELTFKRVSNFIDKAKAKRNIADFIMVTFLHHRYLSEKEKQEAIDFWKSRGIKRISYFEEPISRAGNVKEIKKIENKSVKGCISIWANEMAHIVENGDMILCCMDWRRKVILGNVNENTIHEIWHSRKYQDTRAKRDGREDSNDDFICKRCEMAIPGYKMVSTKERSKGVPNAGGNNADILLVTLPPWGVENPPIGLGYLDSYMRNKGLKTKVYDFNIYFYNTINNAYKMLWHVENKNYWSNEKTFPAICKLFESQLTYAVEKILSHDTSLIGFSVVDPKERITIEIIKRIKKFSPQKKIILGGPACSTEEQRNFFTDCIPGYIDYFVVGEGEETLYEIIQGERKKSNNKNVAGLAYKVNGTWRSLIRPPINPLDSIPFPTYQGFDSSQYNGGKSFLVAWSRGCISKCSFCKNYRLFSGYRARSPQHIFEELEFLRDRYGIEEITVSDNLMNGAIGQLSGVCDMLQDKGLKIKWSGQIAPRRGMNDELFSKMYKAGCHKIQIGLESGSDKVLRIMKKIYTSEIAQENIRSAKKAGMETEIFILVGFPGETEKDFIKTYNFIKNNAPSIDTIKSINTLHLIAGTEIYEEYEKFGMKELPSGDWHYLWETRDGNTYAVRKSRAQRLLGLAYDLRLRVMETNIMEGKESLLLDFENKPVSEQTEILKRNINQIQQLPQYSIKPKIPKLDRNFFQFVILALVFVYTLFYITYFWIYKTLKGKALLGGE